jgi:hypothetical protein
MRLLRFDLRVSKPAVAHVVQKITLVADRFPHFILVGAPRFFNKLDL